VSFPTVEIRPPADPGPARRLLGEPWDLLVFISRNAVEQALALAPDAARLAAVQRAAVGRATAAALTRAGLAPQLVPATGFDSEALLALPALEQVAGRRVLILRGEGGRALLGDTLRSRGAEVAYAEVYRRAAPETTAADAIADWQRSLGYVTATSDEVLTNLLALVPQSAHAWLKSLPLAVLSRRNAATAGEMGFTSVAVAPEASDAGLCAALTTLAVPIEPPA
jgi:uroporphyrinogen-III synthase